MEQFGLEYVVVDSGSVIDRLRVLCTEGKFQVLNGADRDLIDIEDRRVRTEKDFVDARCIFVTGAEFSRFAHRHIARAGISYLAAARTGFRPARIVGDKRFGRYVCRAAGLVVNHVAGAGTGFVVAAQIDFGAAAAGGEPYVVDSEYGSLVYCILHIEVGSLILQFELRCGEYPIRIGLLIGEIHGRPVGAVGTQREVEQLGFEYVVIFLLVEIDCFRILRAEGKLQILCVVELDLIDDQGGVLRSEECLVDARCAFVTGAELTRFTNGHIAFAGIGYVAGTRACFSPAGVVGDKRFGRNVGRTEGLIIDGVARRGIRSGTRPPPVA